MNESHAPRWNTTIGNSHFKAPSFIDYVWHCLFVCVSLVVGQPNEIQLKAAIFRVKASKESPKYQIIKYEQNEWRAEHIFRAVIRHIAISIYTSFVAVVRCHFLSFLNIFFIIIKSKHVFHIDVSPYALCCGFILWFWFFREERCSCVS